MKIAVVLAARVISWLALSFTSVGVCSPPSIVESAEADCPSCKTSTGGHSEQPIADSGSIHVATGLSWVLDTSPYPPRWQCGEWAASIGWLHILSDVVTWLAYVAIPMMLIYFVRKRGNVPFNWLFWLFGAFIMFCGTTHLMEAVIFWWPAYGLSGVIKLSTALVSAATVVALFYAIPKALAFRSPQELEEEVLRRTSELEIAREQANRVIEASPVGMIMVDSEGRIVLTNDAANRLFGYSRDELQGCQVEILVPEQFRSEHPELRQEFFSNPSMREMGRGRDLFGVHKSGHQIPIEIGLNPVNTDDGVCILCSIVDLQERKKVALELQRHATRLAQANEDLEQFAYAASHDMKSPLRAIDNLATWIAKDVGEDLPGNSAKHLEQLQGRVKRMEALLDDLLNYSRAGREAYDLELVDCHALIEEILATLNVPESFRIEVDADLPPFHARKAAIRQVLMNLVSNAIKHHDRCDGRVTVTAQDGDSCIEFIVADDGPGIPADLHERAFRPFQTLQSRDKVEGTGLGLSIVKRLVENEGGSIQLTSSADGGCRFRVTWTKQPVKEWKATT